MGYRMIVVGTDGSPTATIARDVALRFAKRCHARLVVVTAYEPPRISRPMAESLLRHAAEAARREGVEAAFEVSEADPSELILEVAERYEADLLVLGNKGIGQATRFKLGSVPDRVAHYAPCDLLIVETSKHPDRPRSNRLYRKFVAATDGSATASEAARTAFELAVLMRGEVTLVFVGDPIVGAIMLEETASSRPEGVWTEPAIEQGDPAEQICLVAEREGADLIVVGNKGMSGARRFLL